MCLIFLYFRQMISIALLSSRATMFLTWNERYVLECSRDVYLQDMRDSTPKDRLELNQAQHMQDLGSSSPICRTNSGASCGI